MSSNQGGQSSLAAAAAAEKGKSKEKKAKAVGITNSSSNNNSDEVLDAFCHPISDYKATLLELNDLEMTFDINHEAALREVEKLVEGMLQQI